MFGSGNKYLSIRTFMIGGWGCLLSMEALTEPQTDRDGVGWRKMLFNPLFFLLINILSMMVTKVTKLFSYFKSFYPTRVCQAITSDIIEISSCIIYHMKGDTNNSLLKIANIQLIL